MEGIELTGPFPSDCLQNITFLTKLSLRNNAIFGPLPLPNLNNLTHPEFVFLSHNRFTGKIPFEYTELPRLKQLELQENYIDGQIPPFDQPSLMVFNVSYNHLEGQIPQTDVLQRFPKSSYEHNSGLCGNPLENQCPVPPPPLVNSPPPSPVPLPQPPDKNKKKKLHVWNVVLIAAATALVPFLAREMKECPDQVDA